MANVKCISFSSDGEQLAYSGPDGVLKIWETNTGTLKQEYTPSSHLSTRCTCVEWSAKPQTSTSSPRKKRKKKGGGGDVIGLGTLTGEILLFSPSRGDLEGQLSDGHSGAVNGLSWLDNSLLYSCSDDRHIVEWDVPGRVSKRKWKVGHEKVCSVLVLPDGESLLSAGQTISWWNLRTITVVQEFTGHAGYITQLLHVDVPSTDGAYFLSVAEGDSYVNVWQLNSGAGRHSLASFSLQDEPSWVQVTASKKREPCRMVAVSRSGALHIFEHQLNGRCTKPLKPKLTVQIASDSKTNKAAARPIPILGAFICNDVEPAILIGYGSFLRPIFEKLNYKSLEADTVLVRQDSKKAFVSLHNSSFTKVKEPEIGQDVQYLAPELLTRTVRKRKSSISETTHSHHLPMEERLHNLALERPESTGSPPKADSLAQLLVQGLHSHDARILHSVLFTKNDKLVMSTVIRLPVHMVIPLLNELRRLIQERGQAVESAVRWMKVLLRVHAGHLSNCPESAELLGPLIGLIEAKTTLLAPLSALRGRLDLILEQRETPIEQGPDPSVPPLVAVQDDSSDEGSEVADGLLPSWDSDEKWDEFSEGSSEAAQDVEMDGESEGDSS